MSYKYDLEGQLTNVIDAASNALTNWYNNQGLVSLSSNAFGRVASNQYDQWDRLTNTVDANGVTATTTYDALGRVATRAVTGAGAESFGYSARGVVAYTNQLGKVWR